MRRKRLHSKGEKREIREERKDPALSLLQRGGGGGGGAGQLGMGRAKQKKGGDPALSGADKGEKGPRPLMADAESDRKGGERESPGFGASVRKGSW